LVKTGIDIKALLKACGNGASEMVANLSLSLVNMLYNLQLLEYVGTNGVVAYGVIMYIGFIFIGTYLGYSIGTAPIIGYHYGAKNTDELKSLFRKSIKLLIIISIIMTGIAEIVARPLSSIFVGYDKELLNLTTMAIRIYSLSYLVSAINIFTSSFFTALNDGKISAIVSFLRTLLFQIVAIYLIPLLIPNIGIWLAIVIAEVVSLVTCIIFLLFNRKKYNYA
jgi:Na+-driven multidrug efflux pump